MNIIDDDKKFEIDVRTRKVKYTGEGEVRLIQGDHNSERITFTMDRYVENHDMSSCSKVEIHYVNVDSTGKKESEDVYTVDDVEVGASDGKIIFSWLVSKSATQYAGKVIFGINFRNLDENNNITYSWSTGINSEIIIGEGMSCDENSDEEYSDILARWETIILKRLENYVQSKDFIVTCTATGGSTTGVTITNASAGWDEIRKAVDSDINVVLKLDFNDGADVFYARMDHDNEHGDYYYWSYLNGSVQYMVENSYDNLWYVRKIADIAAINNKQDKDLMVTCNVTVNSADNTLTITDVSASWSEINKAVNSGTNVILKAVFSELEYYYARLQNWENKTYYWNFWWSKGKCDIYCQHTNHWYGNYDEFFSSAKITPQMHSRIFRGKNLGETYTDFQKRQVSNGIFGNLFLGDYWEIDGVKWRIVDIDYWYGTGFKNTSKHHLVIMPDEKLYTHVMNDTYSTKGGYVGSKLYNEGLAEAKTIINKVFGDRVLQHDEQLSNAVASGVQSGVANYASTVDIPSEIMIYGTNIWSSAVNDGSGNIPLATFSRTQLALFNVAPFYIQPLRDGVGYWLRDVVSSGGWAYVDSMGRAGRCSAQLEEGVRPVFAIY